MAPKAAPSHNATQDIQDTPAKWTNEDTRKTIASLSERDDQGIFSNLESYNTENKQQAADKMPKTTNLITKLGVSKSKAAHKTKAMIARYKKQRAIVDYTSWGVDPRNQWPASESRKWDDRAAHSFSQRSGGTMTLRIFLEVIQTSLPLNLVESGAPDRVGSKEVGTEEEYEDQDAEGDYEAVHWPESEPDEAARRVLYSGPPLLSLQSF